MSVGDLWIRRTSHVHVYFPVMLITIPSCSYIGGERMTDNASADPKGTRLPRCLFIQSQCRKFRLQRMPPSALSYGVCVLFCQCCYADAKDAVSVGHRPRSSKAKLVIISGNWMHRIECAELRPQ